MSFVYIIFAALLSAVLTRQLTRPGSFLYVLDHPNERSLHSVPVPRSGGIAIMISVYVISLLLVITTASRAPPMWAYAGALMITAVSLLDDYMDLRPVYRITVHLIAAVAMLANGLTLTELALPGFIWLWPAGFGGIVSVLYIVWMINLYNFMDGMDGFAGGMTVIGFTTLGMLGGMAGDTAYATLALIVAASAGGFLLFNYPPARIFMGDAGSSTLGFLAAFFSLWGASLEIFPFWIAVLVFSPFIIDATVTLFRRLLKGERVWQAHKSHFYQRLVQLGWGHKRTVNAEYLVMILCATLALFLNQQPDSTVQWTGLAGMATVYAATMLWITRMERQKGAT